jgi:hypothetical protein
MEHIISEHNGCNIQEKNYTKYYVSSYCDGEYEVTIKLSELESLLKKSLSSVNLPGGSTKYTLSFSLNGENDE